ncbi:MAG: hypothetical protein L0221_11500 [Chloroflexi bacterium]|nr:hypothetical protein [Chloroflexota bacterium]
MNGPDHSVVPSVWSRITNLTVDRGAGSWLITSGGERCAKKVIAGALERKLIVLSAGSYGNVSRIIPPLVTTADEVDRALAILDDSLTAAEA